jgi:hypothetical protein
MKILLHVLATGLLAGLLAPSVDASISVASSSAAEATNLRMHEREREHQKALAVLMSNMTLTSALQMLGTKASAPPQLLALVQDVLQGSSRRVGKAGGLQQSTMSHLRAGGKSNPTGYSGVDKAKAMLNQMIEEVQTKYDLELQNCCSYDETQSMLIEEARQDISRFNAEAAEARAECLDAGSVINTCDRRLPELTEALATHNKECQDEITSLRAQLKIAISDLTVMDKILGMTNCDKSLFLLRCEDECTGESLVKFGHDTLHSVASSLQSSAVRQLLNQSLVEAYGSADGYTPGINLTTWKPQIHSKMTGPRSGPCKNPKPLDKRTGKCSMNSNPDCSKMQEKFKYIQAGVEDKRDELQEQISKLETDCKHVEANLQAQISDFESKLKDAQTYLAMGTKKQNNAEGQSRLKSAEQKSLNTDYARMTATCHRNYATLEGETCGLRKIRGELYKMQGQNNPAFFQDCVVSEWKAEECSASCGGGTMRLARTVVTHPVGGAACPVLAASKPCNEERCPIDCVLRDWVGWSECSAKCGGGLMQRQRRVMMEPMHGGEPCGETSEAEGCNLQACDKDCELSDWAPWSACSKMCDRGTSERVRTIIDPAVGDGTCPDMRSDERNEERHCNSFACVKTNPSPTLQCKSRLDVTILIDGSGSLGTKGWEASKKAGAMLARSFGGSGSDVKLAVLLFSYSNKWLQHYSSDCEAAAVAIETVAWPRSLTFTANALYAARSELSLGRADAQSVVIVITDGRPMSMRQTGIAAHALRMQARLVWVPVTRYAPLNEMRHWASYPKEDNFLALSSFDDLENPKKLDLLIADVCPEVA